MAAEALALHIASMVEDGEVARAHSFGQEQCDAVMSTVRIAARVGTEQVEVKSKYVFATVRRA